MPNQHANNAKPKGWHSRGYLPHFDGLQVTQSLTFRLADSLPATLLERWRAEFAMLTENDAHIEMRKRCEKYLDAGYGACALREARIAQVVEDAFLFFDDQRYLLHAWVIMPNHAHVLLTPLEEYSLSSIIYSLKSYTANVANRLLEQQGKFWFEDYFDRYIRDEQHYGKAVAYIENNPSKAGLCATPQEWRWSSAWRRTCGQDDRAPREL